MTVFDLMIVLLFVGAVIEAIVDGLTGTDDG